MAYRNEAVVSVQTVSCWFRKFRAGKFNLEDEERCGHRVPSTMAMIRSVFVVNGWPQNFSQINFTVSELPKLTQPFLKPMQAYKF